MEKEKALSALRNNPEIFVLISLCTKMPYVECDPETFDDEIFIYLKEEDIKREGAKMAEKKIPVQIGKVEQKQRLGFFTNLHTMGVNSILINAHMEDELRIELTDLIRRPDPAKLPEGQVLVENQGLHLTALYFMQEVRRKKFETLPDELKEMQEEILADYSRGTFIAAIHENNGIPLLKLPNGDAFQPIFTDIIEFQKFNKEKNMKAVVLAAAKIPDVLAKEAKGVAVNPMGINLQLPIKRREAPKEQ